MMREKKELGERIEARGGFHVDPKVEQFVESRQKPNQLDRSKAVYFRDDDKDFSSLGLPYDEGFVHVVEPIGTVERRDVSWLGELQKRMHNNPMVQNAGAENRREFAGLSNEELADNYLSGVLSNSPVLEYLAEAVTVVAPLPDKAVSTLKPGSLAAVAAEIMKNG
jgi:hypothetical protein